MHLTWGPRPRLGLGEGGAWARRDVSIRKTGDTRSLSKSPRKKKTLFQQASLSAGLLSRLNNTTQPELTVHKGFRAGPQCISAVKLVHTVSHYSRLFRPQSFEGNYREYLHTGAGLNGVYYKHWSKAVSMTLNSPAPLPGGFLLARWWRVAACQ